MKNKTCGECRFHDKDDHCGFVGFTRPANLSACRNFEPKPTLFDRITVSPEVLAKSSVYCLSSDLCRTDDGKFTVKRNWKSPFIDRCYDTEEAAIAATVAKLKEVNNV